MRTYCKIHEIYDRGELGGYHCQVCGHIPTTIDLTAHLVNDHDLIYKSEVNIESGGMVHQKQRVLR
jgi:hypothetical protein